jgi:periplasmic protein TonB
VNQGTARQELRMPLLCGWLGSIALHGLLLLSFLSLFRQSLIPVPKETFHWDVALVQTIPAAHEPVQTTDVFQPSVPKQPDRISTSSHSYSTTSHAPVERITARAPKADAPVASSSEIATTSIPNELPSTLNQTTEPLIVSPTQEPPVQETAVTPPSEENTLPPEIARPATVSDATIVSTARPDYGWLQQAIFRRLEELKRSSRPLLDESRPLKVMVKAVVSNEGMLLDSAIVRSSGLDRIDQEAMALVQRVFPLQLDRSLDRRQIVMRIPITYSHE